MSPRVKDVIAVVLVVAGLGLVTLSYLRSQRALPDPPTQGEAAHVQIDPTRLLESQDFTFIDGAPQEDGASILAAFVLHARVCPACLNELGEYTELLRDYERESPGIRALALVLEQDDQRARRFAMAAELPLPVGHGYPEGLAQRLTTFGDGSASQQLVFIDLAQRVLFYRTPLANTLTPLDHKRSVLDDMLAAWEALPR